MDKADRKLLEVVEIWPYLTTWQKYRLLLAAIWWARVILPTRRMWNKMNLKGEARIKLYTTILAAFALVVALSIIDHRFSYIFAAWLLAFIGACLALSYDL
ncbi:MAG TPA: hypothetical protein VE136_18665 [Anaerolineales bacterium]|jgi:hypothetical protein|nr:hypothetical protein [Anaerolineales bacterium]